jgi:hypothetical protein
VLTQKGVREGDYWKTRIEHPMNGDPLPDSIADVNAEMNYFAQQLSRNLPKSPEWEWINARLGLLKHLHGTLLTHPSDVYQQNITQHGGVMNAS